MKNKIGLLSLLILFVFSLGNAQNTQVLKVNDTLSDYEVEDEFEEDFSEINYSFDKFKKLVNGIRYQNYKIQMCISEEGQYISTFMQGLDQSFVIVAISNQGFQDGVFLNRGQKYEHFSNKGLNLH